MTPDEPEGTPLRCGVVGVGYLGQHHARIYRSMPGVNLQGVFDLDRSRAESVAGTHGCRVFESLSDLARACDAVSVVVPTDRHCEVAIDLLGQGCHLLIEKPLCQNLAEAEAILRAARAAGVVVQVGHIEHYNPVMAFLEQSVNQPRFITADRLAPFNPRGTEVGVVLDLMIHDIGIILQLVKAPLERIDAVGVQVLTGTEDIANARMTFADGCVANLNTSRVSQKKVREIRVFQPNVYLSLDFMNQSGHLLRKQGLDLAREEIPLLKGEPLALELASFVECVRGRSAPKVSGQMGKSALEVAIAVTDAIRRRGQI